MQLIVNICFIGVCVNDAKEYLIEQLNNICRKKMVRIDLASESGVALHNGFQPSVPHFEYVLSGNLPICLSHGDKIIEKNKTAGDLIYVSPGAWIGRYHNTRRSLLVINVFNDGVECYRSYHEAKSTDMPKQRISYYSYRPLDQGVFHILKAFDYYVVGENQVLKNSLLKSFLYGIVNHLESDEKEKRTKAHATFKMILQFMKEQCHLAIDRQVVAAEFGITVDYISHLFQRFHNDSFNNTLNNLKMTKASLLLQQTTLNVKQIAEQLGYPETSYFIKVFRHHFGVTPGTYRLEEQVKG
jgi:AraC-like DNA-binding protein